MPAAQEWAQRRNLQFEPGCGYVGIEYPDTYPTSDLKKKEKKNWTRPNIIHIHIFSLYAFWTKITIFEILLLSYMYNDGKKILHKKSDLIGNLDQYVQNVLENGFESDLFFEMRIRNRLKYLDRQLCWFEGLLSGWIKIQICQSSE